MIISKNARLGLLTAIAAFFVFSTTAMAQVEHHSQVSIQGTALVTKDTNSDSSPLSQRTTKSGGFLVGYSYQFNSWAGAEGNYGYTQNTLNTAGSFGQSSIRSDFHEMPGASMPVSTDRPKRHSYMVVASTSISHTTSVCARSIAVSCTRLPTLISA